MNLEVDQVHHNLCLPPPCCSIFRYCLTQHPDVEAKLLSELAAAGVPLGDLEGCSRLLLDDGGRSMLQQLPYLTAVLQEAMRMYPAGVAAAPR